MCKLYATSFVRYSEVLDVTLLEFESASPCYCTPGMEILEFSLWDLHVGANVCFLPSSTSVIQCWREIPLLLLILYSSKENSLWNYTEYYIENSYSWVNIQYRRLLDPSILYRLTKTFSDFSFWVSTLAFDHSSLYHGILCLLYFVLCRRICLHNLLARADIQLSKIHDVCLIIIWKVMINIEVICKENILLKCSFAKCLNLQVF
jgi:hypothetical protein